MSNVDKHTVAIQMTGIVKKFGDFTANDHINLTVHKGEVHAILGENGAGKSTLMNILYGLYQPTEGTITVNGEEVVIDSPQKAIDLGIGMVHQHFMLIQPFNRNGKYCPWHGAKKRNCGGYQVCEKPDPGSFRALQPAGGPGRRRSRTSPWADDSSEGWKSGFGGPVSRSQAL